MKHTESVMAPRRTARRPGDVLLPAHRCRGRRWPGALIGSRFETGIEQRFLEDVGAALKPDTSARFLMVKSGADAAAVVAFNPFKGTVYQTTLAPDFEDSLRRALAGTG